MPVRCALLAFAVFAAGTCPAFERDAAKARMAEFTSHFDPDHLDAAAEREELAWFLGGGDKAWDFVKDTFNDWDGRRRLAALYIFCLNWPERCEDRLAKALRSDDRELLRFAVRLKAWLRDRERLQFVQVVDDPRAIAECAVLEGETYRALLRRCAGLKEERLEAQRNKEISAEVLRIQPNLFRGAIVSRHGVVIEAQHAELTPKYGLPGYTLIKALFISKTRELYAVRILLEPGRGEKLLEKLQKGHAEGKNPVMRLSGYFFKCYARNSAKKGDTPWREPLLIAPEPSFPKLGWEANAQEELEESGYADYLPSKDMDAPKTERRMVVEILPGSGETIRVAIGGQEGTLDNLAFLRQALEAFRADLAEDQREDCSAVVFRRAGASAETLLPALDAIKELGLKRVFYKDENEALMASLRHALQKEDEKK